MPVEFEDTSGFVEDCTVSVDVSPRGCACIDIVHDDCTTSSIRLGTRDEAVKWLLDAAAKLQALP